MLLKSHYRKLGKALIILGLFSIYLLSTGLAKNLLIRPLENNYRPLQEGVTADAIVILTNGARDLSHLRLGPRPDMYALERVLHGYLIYKRLKDVPVIISGGKADPSSPDLSMGASLGEAAIELGIPKNHLLMEDDSINTNDGALKVAALLKGKGKKVILVTSGFHMGRSATLYRNAGFTVFAAPTNFVGEPVTLSFHSFIPKADNLAISRIALYEYLCTLWYIVAGTF